MTDKVKKMTKLLYDMTHDLRKSSFSSGYARGVYDSLEVEDCDLSLYKERGEKAFELFGGDEGND